MSGFERGRTGVLLVLATSVALVVLPSVARADAPFRNETHFVTDFPFTCSGFVANVHAIDDQVFVSYSDGTYSMHVDEGETFSYGTHYVVAHNRYVAKGADGATQSEGISQLWSADGRLLYTAAGQSSWSITGGTDLTPHYDPSPLWDLLCEQLSPS